MSPNDTSIPAPSAEQLDSNSDQNRNDNALAREGVEDLLQPDSGGRPDPVTERVPPEPGKREVIQRSPSDDIRANIAARFKRDNEVPFDGDMTNPENLYGDFGRQPEQEVNPEPSIVGEAIQPAPTAKTYKIKVRGQDVTLTEDQLLERASKVEAADSYLAESRQLLEEAKTIKAERAGRDRQHPDGQSSTQDDGQDNDDRQNQTRHPAPDFKSVVEKIQFGDPEEAARDLEKIVDNAANKSANEGHIARLFNNDLSKSQKALEDFRAANKDLDGDELAEAGMEKIMYKLYEEELVNLGYEQAQIPKDPKTLANWHRFARINGHEVSPTANLLTKARERFDEWRGVSKKAQEPQQAARKEAPRVEVNVNRTERRAAIPTQPTRSVAPIPDAQRNPVRSTGSDIVAQMRKARGQV